MTNQKNGRQPIDEFIEQIPLDRVIEVHLANGFYVNDYYIDAHSGVVSEELHEIAIKIIKKLPNLKLIVFELLPDYLPYISDEDFKNQLVQMHKLWEYRGKDSKTIKRKSTHVKNNYVKNEIKCSEWETIVGELILGKRKYSESNNLIENESGVKIIQELIFHFRASAVVNTLKFSCKLMRLHLGNDHFETILKDFFSQSNPELFPFKVATSFAEFLKQQELNVPLLDKILSFEVSTLQTLTDKKARTIDFPYNPFPVFESLSENKMPELKNENVVYNVEIKPDEETTAKDLLKLNAVFHN